ncbi:MAG: class II fructose-bisphosphate aldolase [Anaerolineae bacterium]
MALVSVLSAIKAAQAGGYALPLFDTFDMAATDGMLQAFEEKRAHAFIGLYGGMFDQPNAVANVAYIRAAAERAGVPASLMLDHGSSFEQCIRAISLGFTDVMFDGSKLPLEENIAQTKLVVRAAHAVGVAVEAELGHVGSGKEYQSFGAKRLGFTDPSVVERFVAETGVDMLAVAIGTAHGVYQGEPKLDLDLLRDIRRRVDIPLVMHGGSGLSNEQFRSAIENGVAKVNVATELFITSAQRIATAARAGEISYFDVNRIAAATFRERCGFYIELFGAAGKA